MSCVPGAAIIVAKQSWSGLSTDLSSVEIYTPTEDGDLIVYSYGQASAYHESTGNGGFSASMSFTSPLGASSASLASVDVGAESPAAETAILSQFRAVSGEPISVSTTFSSSDPTQTYDLFVTLIKI